MSRYTARFSEEQIILDTIPPISTAAQVNGAWVSMSGVARAVAKFNTGLIAATGTLTFQVRQAQDAAGTGAKALKASAAMIDTDDNKVRWIEIRAEELDVDGGFDFIRIEAVAAVAASLVFAELLGFVERYAPAVQPAALTVTV